MSCSTRWTVWPATATIFVLTTNRPDLLESALAARSGRIDLFDGRCAARCVASDDDDRHAVTGEPRRDFFAEAGCCARHECGQGRVVEGGHRWPQRRLPFADDTFDLVLASRAAFAPRQVARVLRSGGRVLTLQGITEWRGETIADALTGTPPDWTLPGFGWDVGDSFRQAGLDILDWTEHRVAVTYHDIGAVVYELLHVPWTVVDFDPEPLSRAPVPSPPPRASGRWFADVYIRT